MAKRDSHDRRWIIAPLVVVSCLVGIVPGRPSFAAWTTLVGNGDPANRVDLVFLGDGYTQSDLDAGLYNAHIQSYFDYMFGAEGYLADPFPRYKKFFNVHKIDVVSSESGADHPAQGIYRDTALDATYGTDGIERLLTINTLKAGAILSQNLTGSGITADIRLTTVNDANYGGSGGEGWATYAGASTDSRDIALHELSHSFSGTADEYVTNSSMYNGPEPQAVNATKDPTGAKWSNWEGYVDPRASYLNIGVFEGADQYKTGIFRPSFNSKMNSLGTPFNAVVREKSILDIYAKVNPLDDWLDNDTAVQDSALWVDVVDPAAILVDWYVDDQKVVTNFGEKFDLAEFVASAGTYAVRAHAYDEIVEHANDGSLLDLVRSHLDALQQDVVWTVNFVPALPGDYNRDHRVDAADYARWKADFGSVDDLAADGNEDGIVDAADYVVWRDNFGNASGAASIADATAPESAGWVLAAMACISVGSSTQRRRVSGLTVFS